MVHISSACLSIVLSHFYLISGQCYVFTAIRTVQRILCTIMIKMTLCKEVNIYIHVRYINNQDFPYHYLHILQIVQTVNYTYIYIYILPASDSEECFGSNDHKQPHGSCIPFLYDSPDYSEGSFLDIHYTPLVYIHILQYVSTRWKNQILTFSAFKVPYFIFST